MCWAERRELKLFTCTNRTLKFASWGYPLQPGVWNNHHTAITDWQGYLLSETIAG